jgi:hypothetical protein
MVAYNKFNNFVQDIAQGVHNFSTDALTYALTNTLPVATNSVIANIAQIAYTNMSSRVPTITSCVQTSGVLKLIIGNLTIAQNTTISAAFQYVVFYNATPAAGPLICWFDYGTSVTLYPGDTFPIQADQTNGVFRIQ